MTIGIIGAMQMEVDTLRESMENISVESCSGIDFIKGTIDGKNVVAAVCGVGKVFAAICAEAMILKYDVDLIINIGVAGSLTKDLGILDVAVATQVVQHDMDTSPLGDPVGLLSGINQVFLKADEKLVSLLCETLEEKKINYRKGTIVTGDQFLHDKETKDRLARMFEGIAGEMEGGSIGHVCFVNQVPFAILRSISDSEGGAMDYQTFAEKAAVQSIDVVLGFINKMS